LNGRSVGLNDEFGNMWKDTITECFKILSQHSPRGTEGKHLELQPGPKLSSRNSNVGQFEYAAGMLIVTVRKSVIRWKTDAIFLYYKELYLEM
jgi:hypothetical protein